MVLPPQAAAWHLAPAGHRRRGLPRAAATAAALCSAWALLAATPRSLRAKVPDAAAPTPGAEEPAESADPEPQPTQRRVPSVAEFRAWGTAAAEPLAPVALAAGAALLALAALGGACAARAAARRRRRSVVVVAAPEPENLKVVPSQAAALRNTPRNAEMLPCQSAAQLAVTMRSQLPRWLELGGAPSMLARTAADAALFLIDMANGLPAEVAEGGVGILVSPYELLPKVSAALRAGRALGARGEAPPFSVCQREDWEQLRASVGGFGGFGGLLLRPTGAVYAVVGGPAMPEGGSCTSAWQALAEQHSGIVGILCECKGTEEAGYGSLWVFHGRRALAAPCLPGPEPGAAAGGLPAAAPGPLPGSAAGRQPRTVGSHLRAYRPREPRALKLAGPPSQTSASWQEQASEPPVADALALAVPRATTPRSAQSRQGKAGQRFESPASEQDPSPGLSKAAAAGPGQDLGRRPLVPPLPFISPPATPPAAAAMVVPLTPAAATSLEAQQDEGSPVADEGRGVGSLLARSDEDSPSPGSRASTRAAAQEEKRSPRAALRAAAEALRPGAPPARRLPGAAAAGGGARQAPRPAGGSGGGGAGGGQGGGGQGGGSRARGAAAKGQSGTGGGGGGLGETAKPQPAA